MMPFVSVVIPCRNESRFIQKCLQSVLSSDYPPDRFEVIVSDGLSDDGTRIIVEEMRRGDVRLRMVDNPRRTTPAALNRAIEDSKGEIIVRMDAHAGIASDYVRRCVETLISSGADNVGGIMHTTPSVEGALARAIAASISHPFGVGNSRFRIHSSAPIWVDTVFGGCYRRQVFDRIGLFNEGLLRGQDMELNLRLRRAGGRILLDPAIESWYHPRPGLASFIAHNWSNGVWAIMPFAWSEGVPVSLRHLVPMAFAATLVATLIYSPIWCFALFGIYFAAAAIASIHAIFRSRDWAMIILPVCFAGLHLPYGFGSLWGGVQLVALLANRRISELRKVGYNSI